MTTNSQKINAKSVARYVLLPGIIPRAKELGLSGFGYLAFLFAQIYMAVRILPPTHPYTQSRNIGTYGIRDVIAAAANNIQVNRKNIDQIIVFVAILAGLAILILQFVLFVTMLLSGTAFAQEETVSAPFLSMFRTEYPETDLAFMMLDYVFGIPDLFGSNALTEAGPSELHKGLHALFRFYNLAILLVGALIFVYYIIVVVVETAQTGVPFGNRFSKIYAPFRLVAAVALLIPLNHGFNSAQYITFYVAKLGSSFATNGWILYNATLANPMGASNSSLVAQATPPEFDGLFQYASIYHACREMYNIYAHTQSGVLSSRETIQIKPYVIVDGVAEEFRSYTYDQAKKQFGTTDATIVLGELDTEKHSSAGGVRPYCGMLTFSLSNQNPIGYKGTEGSGGGGRRTPGGQARGGVRTIEMEYYQLLRRLLTDENSTLAVLGERAAHAYVSAASVENGGVQDFCFKNNILGDASSCKATPLPAIDKLQDDIDRHKTNIQTAIDTGIIDLRDGITLELTEEMAKYGWGGAGMWFNRISEINGAVTGAIYATPNIKAWPQVMEYVRTENLTINVNQGQCNTFNPNLAVGESMNFEREHDRQIAIATNELYQYWCKGPSSDSNAVHRSLSSNAVNDMIGAIFGINGLFTLHADTTMNEETHMPEIHPFAAMTAIGKALVENAVRSMGASIAVSLGGGMVGMMNKFFGEAANNLSGMFVSIATLGLTAGFILYYIMPFLPFIYFFFAMSSWVKSIFEAMVGTPLWALAHLRIDGDGFSGQAALPGYFLLLEIMLRPIATVFGLISSMAVFGASVAVLNSVFYIVIAGLMGEAPSDATGSIIRTDNGTSFSMGMIDQFLFTMMYTILIYLIGNACFKMIDTIPKGFMRWLGTSVTTFNDNSGDPTSNLTTYTAIAGNQIMPQVLGSVNKGAETVGKMAGSIGTIGQQK